MPSNLRELVNNAISRGMRGRQIDVLVCALGGNVLDSAKPVPFLSIRLSGVPAFECFLDGKIGVVAYNWVQHFVSIYPPVPGGFPVARVYSLPVPDIFEFARIGRNLEKGGLKLKPLPIPEFEEAIGTKGHESRISFYCNDSRASTKEFKDLIAGRRASTLLKSGIILRSKGCLRCGREAALLTTTLAGINGDKGIMIGFYLCPKHAKEAAADTNFYHHLHRIFGLPVRAISGRVSFEFLVDAAAEFLKTQLDCRVEKVTERILRKGRPGHTGAKQEVTERTITAVRSTGFKLILKRHDDGDYAYMIQNASGIEIARVDSADHHEVPYGPDHLHRAPAQNNRDVVPSFTYGLPQMDAQIIRSILDQHGG